MHETVLRYVADNIDSLPVVYDWSFNEDTVPLGVKALGRNWFEKNLALKTALHEAWLNGSDDDRKRICDWYIQTWGGIRRNTEDNLRLYGTRHRRRQDMHLTQRDSAAGGRYCPQDIPVAAKSKFSSPKSAECSQAPPEGEKFEKDRIAKLLSVVQQASY